MRLLKYLTEISTSSMTKMRNQIKLLQRLKMGRLFHPFVLRNRRKRKKDAPLDHECDLLAGEIIHLSPNSLPASLIRIPLNKNQIDHILNLRDIFQQAAYFQNHFLDYKYLWV